MRSDNSIEHRETDGTIKVHQNFLKKGPITIGVTSGASTPDKWVLNGKKETKYSAVFSFDGFNKHICIEMLIF